MKNTNVSKPLAKKNRDNPDFPLRRIVKCKCGTSLTGAWSKGKRVSYAYYFCQKRCGYPSIPLNKVDDETISLLERISLKPKGIEAINSLLRETYFKRVTELQKRAENADNDLRKLYELRQALVEKNLLGVYSDEMFKEQNRLVEDKIRKAQYSKNDQMIGKYNIEATTQFIAEKFSDLPKTYKNSTLDQIRVLMCSIFPSGLVWDYPGYSNTKKSPFYQAFLDAEHGGVIYGGPDRNRTCDLLSANEAL